MVKELLEDLDVLDEYSKKDYQLMDYHSIGVISKKGSSEGAVLIDDKWIPKSQLRCDVDGNLYISHWMVSKTF